MWAPRRRDLSRRTLRLERCAERCHSWTLVALPVKWAQGILLSHLELVGVREEHDPQVTQLAFIDLGTRIPQDHAIRRC